MFKNLTIEDSSMLEVKLGVNYHTIRNWFKRNNKPPEYVQNLIDYALLTLGEKTLTEALDNFND